MRELPRLFTTIVAVVLNASSTACFKPGAETASRGSVGRVLAAASAFIVVVGLISSRVAAASTHKRPFTVIDSIDMTKIVDPAPSYTDGGQQEFNRSPDGQKFVVVLRRGHLATDEVEDDLVLFKTKDILTFLNAKRPQKRPPGEILAVFRSSSGKAPIESVRWQGNATLAFIGRTGKQEAGQLYSLNLRTHALNKLTDTPAGVFTFDLDRQGALVYSAPVFPDWTERNRRGYVVGPTTIKNLTITNPRNGDIRDLAFFLRKSNSSVPVRLDTGLNWVATAFGTLPLPNEISISPDGRWAILLATARSIPLSWANYTFVQDNLCSEDHWCHMATEPWPPTQQLRAALDALAPTTALAPRAFWAKEFLLLDMAHATIRPLLNAPGDLGWGTQIRWSADSKEVILGTSYLPLDVPKGSELARRKAAPAVVEVDVPSGTYARIGDRESSISSVRWLAGGDVRIEWLDKATASPQVKYYRERGHRWVEISASLVRWAPPRLALQIEEDLNTPPEIMASDRETSRKGVITDLNPQLRGLTLGHGEIFEWQDRMGRRYRGALILPPGFRPGRHYPLVLQTEFFYPHEFLVDGPGGIPTAYAARALANKGMVVLQMPPHTLSPSQADSKDLTWRYDRDAENPKFVAKMEGAIDELSDRGFIDRTRVGLIGFSRAGMNVQYALTFSKYPIAAATIADSVQATPFAYVLDFGIPYPAGMADFEQQMIGAELWGDGIQKWIKRSPAFHLDKVCTPLRLELNGTHVPEFWDMYVLLKRHQRPVEMIHLPLGAHQLVHPLYRYMSEQGDVDWFAFWLENEVDPDPAKAAQYERWQELRRQYEAGVNSSGAVGHSGNQAWSHCESQASVHKYQ
ncbi:hypothetical protein DWU98_03750 [Dyella monticola]|uniref:Peptidase S9 prolyl oligopeptidase catalytic domain-containing protein n=1 Tax=Dyella monticola TaxID=1927958 RepID=A0A370X9X6_9GAMM|nr:hypothetical protein [Dyella monticola]RDS85060.1 hypothetical protein DWU98_03750 [Dyella monticola]